MQAETADDVTTFRGAVVPAQKECLLMIDLHSGVGMVCVYVGVVRVVQRHAHHLVGTASVGGHSGEDHQQG